MELIDASRLRFDAKSKAECKVELIEARWNGQFRCPACGCEKGYWIRKRALFECSNKKCKKQTSPTAGTQFHKLRALESLWIVLHDLRIDGQRINGRIIRGQTGMSYRGSRRLAERIRRFPIASFNRPFHSNNESKTQLLFVRRITQGTN